MNCRDIPCGKRPLIPANARARFEDGSLSHKETVAYVQSLVDTGEIHSRDESYARVARLLIQTGEVISND